MIRTLIVVQLLWVIGCGTQDSKPKTIIIEENQSTTSSDSITYTEIIEPLIPEGAVSANFNGDQDSSYVYISRIDSINEMTYISFENDNYKELAVPKIQGGSISPFSMDGFDRDLLLLTAKLKDPNFNKYYLFVLRDNQLKPVMNGFAIHKSNLTDSLKPFQLNPMNPDEILRHYSVFNLDEESDLGYTWLLLEESVDIENR